MLCTLMIRRKLIDMNFAYFKPCLSIDFGLNFEIRRQQEVLLDFRVHRRLFFNRGLYMMIARCFVTQKKNIRKIADTNVSSS